MENHVKKLYHRLPVFLIGLVVWSSLFVSCKDVYKYDNEQPDWLGESIYEYLATDGNYTNFVRIIDDLGYSEVLKKTGSKTLFVADDDAFERFYGNNEWGASRYTDLTESQKKLILNFSVVNNAYLIETLSNYYDNTLMEGSALRRNTSVSYLDSVPFVKDENLPVTNRWRYYLDDSKPGMYLLQDGSAYPLVHFLQKSLDYYGITNSDFKTMTGIDRVRNDAHIFSHKVIEPDITCKNGYIHKLDDLLTIPASMAAYIRTVPAMNYFSTMLDWFSAPYPDLEKTRAYRAYLDKRGIPFSIEDTVFTMRYLNSATTNNGGKTSDPKGVTVPTNSLLLFDPGYNNLINTSGALQSDMAAIFSPTNQAFKDYLVSEKGRPLHDRFENISDIFPKETDGADLMSRKMRIMAKLINRHLRTSLVISIPSLFWKMVDNTSSLLGTRQEDIVDSLNYIGLNGLVYATNKVYPPDDFISVYGPVFFSDKTSVLNYGIETYKYNLYLNSMVNKYAFVAPTNKALERFIDPVTYGIDNKETVLEFWYDDSPSVQAVKAKIYAYNKVTNTVGALVGEVSDKDFIKSRLNSILDQSIIVKDFVGSDGSFKDGYYLTKDGNVIKTTGIEGLTVNDVSSPTTSFQGGGDIISTPQQYVHPKDSGIYHQENGTTFLTDKLIQTPLRSVYSILNDDVNYPEFSKFNEILDGFSKNEIYIDPQKPSGIDKTIKFFNSYRYTVYVPDNAAIQQAYDSAWIKSWDDIDAMPIEIVGNTDKQNKLLVDAKDAEIEKLLRFVRYHFQDNSVFISPNQSFAGTFQTATIKETSSEPDEAGYDPSFLGTAKKKFYRIAVTDTTDTSNRKTLSLKCEKYGDGVNPYVVNVNVSNAKYYNIMTRDYIFSVKLTDITSRTDAVYTKSLITTSSTAVIHRIGKVLRFE